MFEAKIIADSIHKGKRITTMQLTYPRYVHSEFMTHRVFSRNASSSRAIPVAKLIETSVANAVYPIRWGRNQSGMQAAMEDLSDDDSIRAKEIWDEMMEACVKGVRELSELGLHKQWANRALEWFGNITVVVTATEWDNFYELRDHPMAQPEIHMLAKLMRQAHENSIPVELLSGEWHLPYITEYEKMTGTDISALIKMSVARCARVSYLNQEGKTPTLEQDLQLYDRLVGSEPLHASPCEHQATPMIEKDQESLQGNFRGWVQYRKLVEDDFKK